jgi:PIN domain nuclease of toxin-antitoxin system
VGKQSVKVLLDTHALLWWFADDPRLSAATREVIANADNEIWVSAASAWEIATKAALANWQVWRVCCQTLMR